MDWLNHYGQYTKDHFSPGIYHLWVGISCISAALERKVWVKLFADDIYPNQYVVLVGPPGIGKGAALAMGKKLMKRVEGIDFGPNKITFEKLIRRIGQAQDTYELDGKLHMHSSVTLISDELGVFIMPKNDELIDFLNDIWTSEHHPDYTYETKHEGNDYIVGPWLNILGATTPEFFDTPIMTRVIGSGFSARLIPLHAERHRRKNLDPVARQQMESWIEPLARDLNQINRLSGEFTFTPDAWAWFRPWVENSKQTMIANSALATFKDRMTTHLLKLSMIMSAAEGGNNMKITKYNVTMALNHLHMVEKSIKRLFLGTGKAATAKDCKTMLLYLASMDEPVTMDQMREDLSYDIAPRDFTVVLGILLNSKDVIQIDLDDGSTVYALVKRDKENKTKEHNHDRNRNKTT